MHTEMVKRGGVIFMNGQINHDWINAELTACKYVERKKWLHDIYKASEAQEGQNGREQK